MEQRKTRELSAPRSRPSTLGNRRTAMRVMHRKSQGIVAVYEQDPAKSQAGTRILVFESATSCACLDHFPAEWTRLSDDELIALRRAQHQH